MGEFPSRDNQFRPGQSGNPGGRPRGLSLATLLRDALLETGGVVSSPDHSRTRAEQLVMKLLDAGINAGELAAIIAIFDRIDGKPRQSVAVETDHTLRDALLQRLRDQHESSPSDEHDSTSNTTH